MSYLHMLVVSKKENNLILIEENKNQAMKYCNKVIAKFSDLSDINQIKIVAFSYCVKALVEYEANKLDAGVNSYRFA